MYLSLAFMFITIYRSEIKNYKNRIMKNIYLVILIFSMPLVAFTQEISERVSDYSQGEVEESSESKNRFSMGWAYYGRGNGVAAIVDREFFELFSQGVGVEEYFEGDEVETSFFLVTEFPIQKLFNITSELEIYPGIEYGSFGGEFESHPFLGFSYPISKTIGVYTEIGSRGVLGLFAKF